MKIETSVEKFQTTIITLSLLLGILFVVPNAKADSSVIWTTTADFDAGNKSIPGQDYFVSNGVDQPTYSFVSKPAAIYVDAVKRTYIVYEGGADFLPYIAYYSHTERIWSAPTIVNATNPVSGDGHGSPAMWIDSSGYIYVFFGAHASAMQLRKSVSPYSISAWTSLASPTPGTPPSNQGTYPHLFEYGGSIYFFYRQGTAAGGDWGFRTSTNGGTSWSSFTTILDFGTDGAYIGNAILVTAQRRVYYTFVWDNRTEILRHNSYVCYWDLQTNTQYGISGTNLGAVVSLTEADTSCRAAYTGTGIVGFSNMKLDSSNRPYLLFPNGTGVVYDTYNITFVRWNGSAWTAQEIITNTDGTSAYTDFIINSPSSIDAFIVTAGFRQIVDPSDDFDGDLERWEWNGVSWSYAETIMYEEKAGIPVNRPHIPLNFNPEISIVFDSWIPKSPLSPKAKIWAWGNGGFVLRGEESSDTPGVETATDNGRISGGTFQLANGLGDTFSTQSDDASSYKWYNYETGDDVVGSVSQQFVGGSYNITVTNPGSSGRNGGTLLGNFGITGSSIDVRVKFTETIPETDVGGNVYWYLCLLSQPDDCIENIYAGTYGVFYREGKDPTDVFAAFKLNGQNGDDWSEEIGSTSFVVCSPCWLRITRVGTVFSFYRSTDGTVWTLDETQDITNFTASTWFPHIAIASNGVNNGNTWSSEADDYRLANGSMDSSGYRPEGSWVSPPQTGSDEVAKYIEITYSGATIDRYIDAVKLLDAEGNVLYTDGTNIISGSSVNITIPQWVLYSLHLVDWSLGIDLIGDGSGSVIIADIRVFTVLAPQLYYTGIAGNSLYILGFIFVLILFFTLMFWLRKRREGVLR